MHDQATHSRFYSRRVEKITIEELGVVSGSLNNGLSDKIATIKFPRVATWPYKSTGNCRN